MQNQSLTEQQQTALDFIESKKNCQSKLPTEVYLTLAKEIGQKLLKGLQPPLIQGFSLIFYDTIQLQSLSMRALWWPSLFPAYLSKQYSTDTSHS